MSHRPTSSLSSRRFGVVLLQQLLGTILKILTGVALAWMLTTDGFGEFSAAYGVMMIASVVAGMGFVRYIVIPYRKAIVSSDFTIARGMRRAIPLSIIAVSLLTGGGLVAGHLLLGDHPAVEVESFAAVLAVLPLVAMSAFLTSTAMVHGAASRAVFLSKPGLQLAMLVGLGTAWWIFGESFDVLDAAAVVGFAFLVICLALWRLNRVVEDRAFKCGPRRVEMSRWTRGSFPYLTKSIVTIVLLQAPFVVLGWVHADAEDAAMFAAAERLAQMVAIFALSAQAILRPAVADVISAGDPAALKGLTRRWFIIVTPTSIIGLGVLWVFGRSLLGLFGPDYVAAYGLLIVISLAITISANLMLLTSAVQYMGRGRFVTITLACWAVGGCVGMVVLGHYWQEMGVAVAQGTAFVGGSVTMAIRAAALARTGWLPSQEADRTS